MGSYARSLCSLGVRLYGQAFDPKIASGERSHVDSVDPREERRRTASPTRLPGHPEPGETFTIKVDPKNGGSSHLVFFIGDIAPGGAIHAHRHPNADEILFLQSGTARVHLGDSVRDIHAGSTVFIPANTWISVNNIGSDNISMGTVFSAPGFEEFMRAGSVHEGEKNVPLTEAENDQIEKTHLSDVIYKEP